MKKYEMTLDLLKAAQNALLTWEKADNVFKLKNDVDEALFFDIGRIWKKTYDLYRQEAYKNE